MEKNNLLEDGNILDYIEEDTIKNKFLVFKTGEEEFGIDIACVKEIINMVNVTQVPSTPNFVKGIINLRGEIIPIIDVRTRFKMEEIEYNDITCIIVIEQEGDKIGLIVDEVNEVKYIFEANISAPPSAKLSYANQFVKNLGRIDDRVILLIEATKLLYEE